MGEVYRARGMRLERTVTVKIFADAPLRVRMRLRVAETSVMMVFSETEMNAR